MWCPSIPPVKESHKKHSIPGGGRFSERGRGGGVDRKTITTPRGRKKKKNNSPKIGPKNEKRGEKEKRLLFP